MACGRSLFSKLLVWTVNDFRYSWCKMWRYQTSVLLHSPVKRDRSCGTRRPLVVMESLSLMEQYPWSTVHFPRASVLCQWRVSVRHMGRSDGRYIAGANIQLYLATSLPANLIFSSLKFKASWLRDETTVQHSTIVRSAHTVFMCFVFICEQTATCATYSINWLVFITGTKSVYCVVRTGSLNKAVCASSLKS